MINREFVVRAAWVPLVEGWLDESIDVFAYFNNDVGGCAVGDAQELLALLNG